LIEKEKTLTVKGEGQPQHKGMRVFKSRLYDVPKERNAPGRSGPPAGS